MMQTIRSKTLMWAWVVMVWGIGSVSLPAAVTLEGDFDLDGKITSNDIDLLTVEVISGANTPSFDLNSDALVNQADRDVWVEEIAFTFYGDANLNGVFNTGDLVHVMQAGEYQDNVVGNSVWETGDWNGDLEFDSSDLVVGLATGAFEGMPRHLPDVPVSPRSVPEPSSGLLMVFGAIAVGFVRRRLDR